MRVLHVAFQRFPAPGIERQMADEQTAAEKLGLDWSAQVYSASGFGGQDRPRASIGTSKRPPRRSEFYSWLNSQTQQADVLLLRHMPGDPLQVLFLAKAKLPVYLVHHTLEGPELATDRRLIGRAKEAVEVITGFLSLRHARGVVAVTPEIARYEALRSGRPDIPALNYPNGLLLPSGRQQFRDRRRGDAPVLLFVASQFVPWHGLDRLLAAAQQCDQDFIVHLVGRVFDDDMAAVASDPRFIPHGVLDAAQIATLIEESWVGLSSFAFDRKAMTQACSLKVREYLAAGLPVYADHTDVFPESFPYFVSGACQFGSILEAARTFRRVTRDEVLSQSKTYIDKTALLARLHRDLKDDLGFAD